MADLYRLAVLLLLGFCSVLSLAATTAPTWGPWGEGEPEAYCSQRFTASGIAASGWSKSATKYYPFTEKEGAICESTCTNATLCGANTGVVGRTSGSVTNWRFKVCAAGYAYDLANNICQSIPGPCEAGTPVTSTADSPWLGKGDWVGAYSFQKGSFDAPGCVGSGPVGCTVVWGSPTAPPMQHDGANGHSYFTVYLGGTKTGATCAVVAPTGQPAEPPCAGQQGTYNSKTVCLPLESQGSKDERAAQAARDAAAAARQSASNAGHTAANADKAGQAAGAAAAQASRNGGTPAQAAAAGAAAGSAAAAHAAANSGAPASTTMDEGSAAGAAQFARDRATQIATAAGLTPAQVAQAASSAGAAAAMAAAQVLNNGGTYAQANAAAAAAGQSATASIIYGSTEGEAATAGANAGASAAAGAGSNGASSGGTQGGTGSQAPQDPVGDFCTKNPQAQMCKNTPDSTFAGACGAPPVCEGDAVMCAVAAATFATNCTLSNPNASTPLYDAALTKSGDQTGALSGNSTVSVSASQFDQTELLGAGSGMSDRTIAVAGHSISIPFSSVNIWLARLGLVLQAVTFLVCARIVIRG